jgi:hypothetical protein
LPLQREYEGLLFHFLKHFLIYADAVLYPAIDAGYAVSPSTSPRTRQGIVAAGVTFPLIDTQPARIIRHTETAWWSLVPVYPDPG